MSIPSDSPNRVPPAAPANLSPLHTLILNEFTRTFGPPHRVMGKDMQWGVQPQPHLPALNILVNGSSDRPIVWVFDPHNLADGVHHEAIYDAAGVASTMVMIQRRVKDAGGADPANAN